MSKYTEINNTMSLIELWIPKLSKKDKQALKQILSVMYNHAKEDGQMSAIKRFNIGK